MNRIIFLAAFSVCSLVPLSVSAGTSIEFVLDGTSYAAESVSYDFGNRVIDMAPKAAFECGGPQAQLGDGLVLRIGEQQVFRLDSARFSRSGGVTRIIAATPGELPTCGPEALIFQDYFR